MTAQPTISRLLRISGQVQGVGYRAWMVREATTRGLDGWVRNRADGTVEALVVGPEVAVGGMIEACRRGPRHAAVTSVHLTEAEPPSELHGFHQRPTE